LTRSRLALLALYLPLLNDAGLMEEVGSGFVLDLVDDFDIIK
jgi:hypothetical protein